MKQKDKQLLLKDLCARLPYGVIVRVHDIKYGDFDSYIDSISNDYIETYPVKELTIDFNPCVFYKLQDIKPYLRPMSSMTEEERDEYRKAIDKDLTILEDSLNAPISYKYADGTVVRDRVLFNEVDWLNKHHFDYRGLIEKLLAIIAPDNMYK